MPVSTPSVQGDMATTTPCFSQAAGVKRKFSCVDVHHDGKYPILNFTWVIIYVIKKVPTAKYLIVTEAGPIKPQKRSKTTTEICESINHDHCYQNSPGSTNKILPRVKKSLRTSRGCLKVLSQHVKRLKISVSSLKRKITALKKKEAAWWTYCKYVNLNGIPLGAVSQTLNNILLKTFFIYRCIC